MGRSQRHRVIIQGSDVNGKGLSEKQPAIVYIRQNAASQALTIPLGIAGGPLKGSSLAGYPPTLFPAPGLLAEREAELHGGEGEFTDPGQFNLSGNPIYTDLPPAGVILPQEPPAIPPPAPDQTLPEPEEPEEPPVQSAQAPGPVLILRVEKVDTGLAITFDSDAEVKTGYHVTLEATGNTSVNGTYEVLSVDGRTIIVDSTAELSGPIEHKGRITVLGD